MLSYKIEKMEKVTNEGIAREWALCRFYGITRTSHDAQAYDKASDIDAGEKQVSVKASGFSLMSGSLCKGCVDFDSIWKRYASRVHSNTFAYVTADYTVYEMTLDEFRSFVYEFGRLERESAKNGGALKIKCRKESKKMVGWLEARAN